jgi:vancomycin permeability regulator SanA
LDAAIDLYRKGKVQRLLLSGDNRRVDYNEPQAMRRYVLAHHVPDGALVMDYAGRDTYDTCFRARHVFGVDQAILVTQRYHAPRALYTARSMGIDAEAYALPNLSRFPLLQLDYSAREYLADLKALWEVEISHRRPYVDSSRSRLALKHGP